MLVYVQLPFKRYAPVEILPEPLQPGDLVEGQGVYIGKYALRGWQRDGKPLGKVFNAFAASQDEPTLMSYEELVTHVAQLKDHHGHDGTPYGEEKELFQALKDGSYRGGWIIPPRALLSGAKRKSGARKGQSTQSGNLFDLKDLGAFKGSFKTDNPDRGSGLSPDWYWSSTPSDKTYAMGSAYFGNGCESASHKINRLSCRLVRLVEIKRLKK